MSTPNRAVLLASAVLITLSGCSPNIDQTTSANESDYCNALLRGASAVVAQYDIYVAVTLVLCVLLSIAIIAASALITEDTPKRVVVTTSLQILLGTTAGLFAYFDNVTTKATALQANVERILAQEIDEGEKPNHTSDCRLARAAWLDQRSSIKDFTNPSESEHQPPALANNGSPANNKIGPSFDEFEGAQIIDELDRLKQNDPSLELPFDTSNIPIHDTYTREQLTEWLVENHELSVEDQAQTDALLELVYGNLSDGRLDGSDPHDRALHAPGPDVGGTQ